MELRGGGGEHLMGDLPTIKKNDNDIVCELFDGPLDGALIVVPPDCSSYTHTHKVFIGSIFMYSVNIDSYVYVRDPRSHRFNYHYPHAQAA